METFIEWLEAELKARDWRPADLAQRAGITDATLSRILSGSRSAGVEVCIAIADAFKVSREEVFRRRGWLEPVPPESQKEAELLYSFRCLSEHDQRAALRVVQSLTGHPSPEPIEVQIVREIPQLEALRQAVTLWGQGKDIEAFWPLFNVLSPAMKEKFEAFLNEIGESESETIRTEGGDQEAI